MRDLHEGIRKAAGAFIDRPGIPQLILREGGSGDARVHAIEPALPVGSLRLVSLSANPLRYSNVRRCGSGIRFVPGKHAARAAIHVPPKQCDAPPLPPPPPPPHTLLPPSFPPPPPPPHPP